MIHNSFSTKVMTAFAAIVLGVAALSVNSCKKPEPSEIPVTDITVSSATLTVKEGESATISFTVSPSDASKDGITFTSSDTSVVTVDKNGVVTAVGPGTATITITSKDGKVTATITVTVEAKTVAVTGISLDKTSITIGVGETQAIVANIEPSNATNKKVNWTSNDSSIASVDDEGNVTGKGVGSATIIATTADGGKKATCSVKVTSSGSSVAVTGIKLDKSSITIGVGESQTLVATIEPSNATNKKVNWATNDSAIATVDDNGTVTGKGVGNATIIATTADGGKKATCSVKVTASSSPVAVTGVTLDKSTLTMTVGEDVTLKATVKPDDATDKTVTWASDKTSVATVDENGKVSAKAAGTAVITVTTKDGGKTAKCTVTVKAASVAVTGVSLDKTTLTLTEGESATLKATVKPDDASNKQVTWSSDKESVATVDENGKVTAKAAGTAVITVTTKDGGKTAKCTVTVKAGTVAVTGVSLDKTSLAMKIGETAILNATVKPDNASNKQVTWSSDKTSIATVDENGKVEAKAAGSATITVTTKDGGKKATCAVSVTAPTIELRTQFLEDKTTAATFGNVIHFKYGTNYRGTANEFLVVPWDYNKNNVVDDTDASHYTATSSRTANVTVTKEKIGSHYAFVVKAVLNPTSSPEAFSDLTFTYTGPGGTKITKSTRLCIASSSATSAFSYKLKGTQKVGSIVDLTSGAFTYTMQKSGDDGYMRVWVNFDDLKYGVPDTKTMASYTYSNSKSSVVGMSEYTNSVSNNPYVELTYKDVGTSNVSVKYVDYKGNKLDKTVKITVNKNYLAGSDRIDYSSTNSNNSTANRYFLPVNKALGLYVRKGDGNMYDTNDLVDITWSVSNSNVTLSTSTSQGCRYCQIMGKTPGDVTVTAKGKDGSTRSYFVTVYKEITTLTPNSTTFIISKGDTHTMTPGVDFTISPSDATYQKVSDFNWRSTNSGFASVGEKNGLVTAKATGTTEIQLMPNKGSWSSGSDYKKARFFQVVEPYVEVRSGCATLPNDTRIAYDGNVILVVGDKVSVGLSDSVGNNYNVMGDTKWNSSTTSTYSVSLTPQNYAGAGYLDITAKSAGTAVVNVIDAGDNGYLRVRINVKVVPKFTWASSDIVANSPGNSRPQDSPGYLAKGTTQTIYAYNGNTTSANAYTSDSSKSILWKSSNTSIATVSPSAGSSTVVTAVGPGKVKITGVDSNGAERSTWIQVYNAVTGITANSKPYLVGYHQSDVTKQMTYGTDYTLSPSNASYTSADNFLWQSGDTSKAEVGYNTGLVTIHSSSFTGPVDITAVPNPDGKKVGYKKVRTVKVVTWKGYSTASWSTSSGTLQGSDGTKEKEGIYHFVNNTTVKLDKDQRANIKFYNILDKTPIGDANYQVTSSNSSIVTAGAVNDFTSSNGNYVTLMPKATGKATITMKIVDVDHYFVMTFTVQVI